MRDSGQRQGLERAWVSLSLGDSEGLELHRHSSWEGKAWGLTHAEDGNCSLGAVWAGQSVWVALQGRAQRHCCCYTQHQTPTLLTRAPAGAAAAKWAQDPSQASHTCLSCLSAVFCTLRCSRAGEQLDTGKAGTPSSAKHCVPHGKESWEAEAIQSFQRVASQKEISSGLQLPQEGQWWGSFNFCSK